MVVYHASNSHKKLDPPWQNMATDLFQLNDHNYVLVVNYYSKYFEVTHLNNTEATSVINQMKVMFARHGIPSMVKTKGHSTVEQNFKNSQNHGDSNTQCPLHIMQRVMVLQKEQFRL